MAPARLKKQSSSKAKHNASGFAKRRANSKQKTSIPKSLHDIYEYTATKNKRSIVKLAHDKAELVGVGYDDDDDNEMSGINIQAIRSRILNLEDVDDIINSDEDEEIDSDAAFEETDAEEYAGFSFSKKSSKNSKPRTLVTSGEINTKEDEEEQLSEEDENEVEGEDGDEDNEEDEYLDVLDVLDGRDEVSEVETNPKKNVRGVKELSKKKQEMEEDVHSEDDGDSEDDEEGEPMEDPFVPSEDDDEDNIDNLDSFIVGLDTTRKRKADDGVAEPSEIQNPRKKRVLEARTEAGAENEFNVPMVSASRLEFKDLLASLESTSALHSLKQSIKPLINGNALPVPLPLRTQEKLDRKAAYEQTKTEISKWDETMKRIKQAEHLTFPLQEPQKLVASNAGLAAKFKPSTEMESAVDKLLRTANLRDDAEIVKAEELKLNHLSVEEVAQRRAELQKMRDLMFRAEIKAKRVAKIKSKTFRKIHRKAREKLKDMTDNADGKIIDEKEERIKHEIERARERATLRHKNTGKWAKAMQARGELDIDQREEIEEMLAKGERLRRRIQADDDDISGEDEDDTSDIEIIKARAFDELERLDQGDTNLLHQKSKGVFAMKFMQNAMVRSVAEVDSAVDQFREEMARLGQRTDGVSDGDVEDKDDDARPDNLVGMSRSGGRLMFQPGQTAATRLHLAPSETSSTLKSSVDPNQSPAVASQVTIRSSPPLFNEDIPLIELSPPPDSRPSVAEPNPWLQPQRKTVKTITRHEVVVGKHSDQQRRMKHQMQKQLNKGIEGRAEAINDAQIEIDLNDVLVLPQESSTTVKEDALGKVSKHTEKNKTGNGVLNDKSDTQKQVDAAYEDSDADSEIAFQEDHLLPNGKENKNAFKQKDLVAMAFAGDNVVEDFSKLKEREVEGDAPRDEDQTLPGWGSWGGSGIKSKHKAKKVIKKVPGIDPTTRADHGKPHVIISEKKDKKAAKYLVKDLPYPYTSKDQFEKVMNAPIGTEWNSRDTFQKKTLPRVLKKMGTVINPLEKLF